MNFQQTVYEWLGRMLGLEQMQSVAGHKFSFAAPWAQRAPMLLFFGFLGLVAAAAVFYFWRQPSKHRGWRAVLFLMRAAVLCQVLLLLAEPILTLTIHSRKRPALWLLFDGTDSMNIADELPANVRAATDKAVGIEEGQAEGYGPTVRSTGFSRNPGEPPGHHVLMVGGTTNSPRPSRIDYLRALVRKKDRNLLEELNKRFRLQAFLFDSTRSVRSLELSRGPGQGTMRSMVNGERLAEQLSSKGQVTDLGGAITDLAHRNPSGSLAGLIVFSDFSNTTGPDPTRAAKNFGAGGTHIYTVGLGATRAAILTANIVAPPYAKTKEEASISVSLQPKGLDGQTTHIRLYAETSDGGNGSRTLIGEQESPPLSDSKRSVEFIYKPEQPGRVQLVAEVDRLPGKVNQEQNVVHGEISVLDDYLRLMFVEYEPTWEWRFVKEVFHRDPLVGMKGFRTYLYSSDPQVRQQNELFLATMTPSREEFFKNDLIFVGDMPSGPPTPALSDRFCDLVKEFVGAKGGGLVVLCGPRFGPQHLAKTPLANLLPVSVDPTARVRDQEAFSLQLTPQALGYPFMQLGEAASLPEMQHAWDNLGPLPWYQPVEGVHPAATVLAEHPTATCGAPGTPGHGKKQPLIAVRQYGRGEVVYLGFNETWRLRRVHGEELFRRFWKEVMWRLALNHALGANKRFVVQTDQHRYPVDQPVTLTVQADNARYEALSENNVSGGTLSGEWVSPGAEPQKPVALSLTQVERGLFATRFVVTAPGEHRVSVTDPITGKPVEWSFTAYSTSVERQNPVRDSDLQEKIATVSGGRSYDLKDVQSLLEQLQPALRTEASVEVVSLVNTWACFVTISALLLGEWLLRKGIGLP